MKIAVAMPQVPFTRGGAELLTDTLIDQIRRRGHEVDSILIPFKWYPAERLLLDSLVWRQFDLTEAHGEKIDLLLCTKFPSYLALHPNKVLWLYHQHRAVYDLFSHELQDFRHDDTGTATRAAITQLDRTGLADCRRIFTISKNVSGRLHQYNGVAAGVLYPPPRGRDNFRAGPYGDYILYVGRLGRMKRVDLLVEAARHLRGKTKVKIAGSGAELDALRGQVAAAGLEHRVELLGFVPDEQLYSLYAGALAVYYAPVDEDYGFTTVEAMLSRKPVLTCADSGGVLEFVRHGETGLSCPPDAKSLAVQIDGLAGDPAAARRMGEAGYEGVRGISWEPVLDALLG